MLNESERRGSFPGKQESQKGKKENSRHMVAQVSALPKGSFSRDVGRVSGGMKNTRNT